MKNTDKILKALNNKEWVMTKEIAKETGIDVKNIGRYTKELHTKGLIEKSIKQQGKIRIVCLRIVSNNNKNIQKKNILPKKNLKIIQKPVVQDGPKIGGQEINIEQNNNKIPEETKKLLIKIIIKATHHRTISQEEADKALKFLYTL